MAKIFSILTILVAAAAIYFGLEADKRAKDLGDAGKKLKETLVRTEGKLRTTETELEQTKTKLAETVAELTATKETLRTTQEKLTKTESDFAAANKELESAKQDLAGIMSILVELFPGTEIKPENLKENISKLKTAITELTASKKSLDEKVGALEKENAMLASRLESSEGQVKTQGEKIVGQTKTIDKYQKNIMEKGVRGRVLAVNPGWGFCVLSVGDKNGAAMNKVMIVSRGGQAIGRVKITNVEANQSVADILTGSFVRGMMIEAGDSVIYTGDDKVKIDETAVGPVNGPTAPPAQPQLPQLPQP